MEVPKRLKDLPQWVCWRIDRNGSKIPVDPTTGRNAASDNPETWTDYQTAAETGRPIGFVFRDGDGLFGIDLDGCINQDGEVAEWATRIIERFPTYAEISPSGSGIKLYGAGTFTGRGRQKEMGDESVNGKFPKVEIYQSGRYFAFTGQRFGEHKEIADCQDSLASFMEEEFPERPRTQTISTYVPGNGDDAERRAAAYLAKKDPTVCGTSSCHDRTFCAACILVIDFALSPDVAFPILADWASRGEHAWSDKELWHKLNSAARREGPRGKFLQQDASNSVNLGALIKTAPSAPLADAQDNDDKEDNPEDPREFPKDVLVGLDGLIGEVVDLNLSTAMYPQPELALSGALALQAVLAGRKIAGERNLRTNVYIIALGYSGAGKEHARDLNKDILIKAGAEKLYAPERIASGAGLTSVLVENPASLFQLDELGRVLATMKTPAKSPHLYGIGTILMQLYSSAGSIYKGDAYADLSKTKTIDQPHAVVYGTATPDSFWNNLTEESVGEGLVGRFMVFESPGYLQMHDAPETIITQSILDRVKWWHELKPQGGNLSAEHPVPYRAEIGQAARERLVEHLRMIAKRRIGENRHRAAVWSRSGEKTAKLALLFACSRAVRLPVEITLADVERAIRLNNYLTRKMIRKVFEHVAENDHEAKVKKVLRLLAKPMTLNQLCRKTQWLRAWEREEILKDLITSGTILRHEIPTSGRPVTKLIRSD